uniref:Secreted protein n=1 Tax=Pipistrellus kuhlii TaxID=59472 RepID=A0A7J7YWL2_PIPKU|nr:hypothetical protein mPipKuh1_009836 [Pipistrellus kuhlii]
MRYSLMLMFLRRLKGWAVSNVYSPPPPKKKKKEKKKNVLKGYRAAQNSSCWTVRLGKWPGGSISSSQARKGSCTCHMSSLFEEAAASWTHSAGGLCSHDCLGNSGQGRCCHPLPECLLCRPVFKSQVGALIGHI